jgi:methionyl-tRNA synthetase
LGELTNFDNETIAELLTYKEKTEKALDTFHFREALKEAMNIARLGNKYLADTEPWKVIKADEKRVETIMNICVQITANLTIVLEPFMPFTAKKIGKILNIEPLSWNNLGKVNLINSGHIIEKPFLLFDKIEDSEIEKQINKLLDTKKANENDNIKVTPAKDEISFDDFVKTDIRIGTILEAEKVPKTKKLLKLLIDTGIDKRTVVSGIAEYYKHEDIIGKKVSILVNLSPRKIRGIESHGMILMAENHNGELSFISPDKDFVNGSEIR